jgi:hypothetical protein
MPAFTFEKISPPRPGAPPAHSSHSQPKSQSVSPNGASPQQRDNVIQILGRFVIARVRDDRTTSDRDSTQ